MSHAGWMAIVIGALVTLGTGRQPAQVQRPPIEPTQVYALWNTISIELPTSWHAPKSDDFSLSGTLGPFAPPFHFSQVAIFTNEKQNSILLLGLSDNPLLGHDSYWLDAQIHAPSGSGISMLDLVFYFFFPPSQTCLDNALQNYTDATMTPTSADAPPPYAGDLYLSASADTFRLLLGASQLGDNI